MAILNESTVEDANLSWFRELSYAIGHGPYMAPGEATVERESFGDVMLVRRLRETIRRLNPAIPFPALATLLPELLSGKTRLVDPKMEVDRV